MSLLDDMKGMLTQYAAGTAPSGDAGAHFQQAAQSLDSGILAQGIAAAMRSDQTPPFAQLVSQLFASGSGDQRTAMLSTLLSSIGPRYHEQARRPITSSDALTRLFARHRACITVEPATAARSLRALTLSTTHPMMIDEPMSPDELVELFLHGIGTRKAGAPC